MKFKLLAAVVAWGAASAYSLEGTITGNEGEPIVGASVKVVGQSLSSTTDEQGKFTLDIDRAEELHIAAPGYAHQTLHIEAEALNTAQNITLNRSAIEQVDVVGIPLHISNIESAMPVNVLVGDELRKKQASTLGDSLANEVGVHSDFHGNVASTPIIRGLSGPRVMITQNSLDVSDVSRVGPDHSVSAEVSTAEQLEVLRGPATLFFGSGAIGGVVNVVDKRVPTTAETSGEWLLSRDSVNDQELASFNLNTGSGNVAFHLDGFWREADNYEVPVSPEVDEDHGEREVPSTAEESHGYNFGSSLILDNGYVGFSYGKLDREYGVPGHAHGDEHEEEGEGEGEGDHHEEEESVILGLEQDRFQLISELALDGFLSAMNTRVGYTDYEHTEFENGGVGTTFSNESTEVKLELMHQPLADWHGGLTFDYKNSKFVADGEEAFAPPSDTDTLALALLEEKHFGSVLVQMGARIEHVSIKSNRVTIPDVEFHPAGEEEEEGEGEGEGEEHEAEVFSFGEDYTPVSVSIGAVWDFAQGYNMGLSLSHAQRAPSAAELLSFGPHVATRTYEVGALFDLHEEDDEFHFEPVSGKKQMEKSNNIDLTFRKFEGDVGIILNAFYNKIDNYYAQYDQGLDAHIELHHDEEEGEGEGEEEHDEHGGDLPVLRFDDRGASLRGVEAQFVWQMNSRLKGAFNGDYVNAKLDRGGYLPRIPPMRLGFGLDYEHERLSAGFIWTAYRDQKDSAISESDTEGYRWVDANISYSFPFNRSELTVFLKGENLGDEEARVHSSVLKDLAPRPGRNYRIGVRGTF